MNLLKEFKMSRENTSFFCFTLGLLLTLGGVGGVETSETTLALLGSVVASGVGLLTMWVGTVLMKQTD
jgi:hypothetical protein